jgi:hypothetical protein
MNKSDAARRQINAAIRMTFNGEEPVAILAVIAGAHRIIKDICEGRGDIDSYRHFKNWIAPGKEAEFWRHWNASMNFIKHADNDPNDIVEFDDENTDFLIMLTSKWYADLGNGPSEEMRHFAGFYGIHHPDFIKPETLQELGSTYSAQITEAIEYSKVLTRREKLIAARIGAEAAGVRMQMP